jgi:hypothetical protein
MGISRLRGIKENNDLETCPVCREEGGWDDILRFEGNRSWRDKLVDNRLTFIDLEIGIIKMV